MGKMKYSWKCSQCDGTGYEDWGFDGGGALVGETVCSTCNGVGWVLPNEDDEDDDEDSQE